MSHAGALLRSPSRRRRRERKPPRRSRKTRGSTSPSSNCVRIDIACHRVSNSIVWTALKRSLRLVVLLNQKDPAKPRFIVRASPDPNLHGHKLLDLYAARFHIELLFRDSTQFTGLLDCQARAASAVDFHCNAALATLHLVRAEDLGIQEGQEPH